MRGLRDVTAGASGEDAVRCQMPGARCAPPHQAHPPGRALRPSGRTVCHPAAPSAAPPIVGELGLTVITPERDEGHA